MDKPAVGLEAAGSGGSEADGAAIVERLESCARTVSGGFSHWSDAHAHGPGLYFVVERAPSTGFVEPMGTNRWRVEDCQSVFDSQDALVETAREVAFACDGAVVVHSDGTIQEVMVRIKQLPTDEREQNGGLTYDEWMGTRHMSALETSTRAEVLAVVTLSEEDGRMTVFRDGTFEDHPRKTVSDTDSTASSESS